MLSFKNCLDRRSISHSKYAIAMDGNTPKISVIVPVYNVIEYLEQCLNSIVNQTMQDIEIIVIDDGSTDGSGQICDDYARNDPRITLLHKKNQGLSAARNDGLAIARAEYIMFVDSDDWVEPDFCSIPYQVAIDSRSDIVIFQRIWHRGNIVDCQQPFPFDGIASKKDVLTDLWSLIGVICWNKLYRRNLFDDIRFPVGRLSEDVAVTHRLVNKANKVYLINEPLYNHRCNRPGSIMDERSVKRASDEATLNMMRYSNLREWGYINKSEEVKQALLYLARMGRDGELSGHCKGIIDENDIADGASWKLRSMYRLCQISPRLLDFIAIITGLRYRR